MRTPIARRAGRQSGCFVCVPHSLSDSCSSVMQHRSMEAAGARWSVGGRRAVNGRSRERLMSPVPLDRTAQSRRPTLFWPLKRHFLDRRNPDVVRAVISRTSKIFLRRRSLHSGVIVLLGVAGDRLRGWRGWFGRSPREQHTLRCLWRPIQGPQVAPMPRDFR